MVAIMAKPETQTHGVLAQPNTPVVWAHEIRKILPKTDEHPAKKPDKRLVKTKNPLS